MELTLLKSKKFTGFFAVVALVAGFLLLDSSSPVSGNIVLDNSSFNFLSLIGLALVLCSAVLAAYTVSG